MNQNEIHDHSNRDILIDIHGRISALGERVAKVETDMSWLKKFVYGIPTVGTIAAVVGGGLLKLKDLVS